MKRRWEIASPQSPQAATPRAVTYYRRSARDRQENSIPIQQEKICQWAQEHGIEIIREFADAGRSGLTAEGRPAFTEMMEEWVRQRDDFDYVLCLDVSRWGRFQDAVLAYAEDPNGTKVCVSNYMDDKIGTIKLWRGDLGAIPEGWRLCDGASGAFGLAGRFPLGVDTDGHSDEDTIGDTGGHPWHGQTQNNHPPHPNHRHAYDTTSDKVDAGQDGTEQAWDASPTSDSWTSGVDNLQGESGELLGHYGPYNSGSDTDNRPPYRVVAFNERFK